MNYSSKSKWGVGNPKFEANCSKMRVVRRTCGWLVSEMREHCALSFEYGNVFYWIHILKFIKKKYNGIKNLKIKD